MLLYAPSFCSECRFFCSSTVLLALSNIFQGPPTLKNPRRNFAIELKKQKPLNREAFAKMGGMIERSSLPFCLVKVLEEGRGLEMGRTFLKEKKTASGREATAWRSPPRTPFKKLSLKKFFGIDQMFLSEHRSFVRSADFFVRALFFWHCRTFFRGRQP